MSAAATLPQFDVVLLAAGSGRRLGGEAKQFRRLANRPVWQHSLDVFAKHPQCRGGVVVCPADYVDRVQGVLAPYISKPPYTGQHAPKHWKAIAGGKYRHDSACAGLEALCDLHNNERIPAMFLSSALVMMHDAARPFISRALLDRLLAAHANTPRNGAIGLGVIPALPPSDALKRVTDGKVEIRVNRQQVLRIQTPQLFEFATLYDSYLKDPLIKGIAGKGESIPESELAVAIETIADDSELYRTYGFPVHTVPGEAMAFKITTSADWEMAEAIADSRFRATSDTRVGFGYDVHRFADARQNKRKPAETKIMLCGVAIPHPRQIIAHSDGDVGLHAATDAVLATLGDGDIGDHFPPSDARWRGADSAQFLAFAAQRLAQAGGQLVHLDLTLIAETPKIAQYREAMRARVFDIIASTDAAASRMQVSHISIKATTCEGLGFIGAGDGLACHAVATVRLPRNVILGENTHAANP